MSLSFHHVGELKLLKSYFFYSLGKITELFFSKELMKEYNYMYVKPNEQQMFLTRISYGFDKDLIRIILCGTKMIST